MKVNTMEMNSSVSKQSNVNEDDEKLMQDLFNVGIGTPATRAGIIEKLVSSGFLERVGECNQPTKFSLTEKGKLLCRVLPASLKSTKLTAEWEAKLSEVEKGTLKPNIFLEQITYFIREILRETTLSREDNSTVEDNHPGTINMVRFLFEQQTSFPDKELMLEILQKHFGELLYFSCDENIIGFATEEYVAEFGDGNKVPVIIQLTGCSDETNYQPDEITLSQMQWSCPMYEEILEKCKYHMVAFDMFGDNLQDYKKRADLTIRMTEALIEMFPTCKAVLFEHSGKMHTREDILNCNLPKERKFIEYMVNVRFFNIQGTEDMVIDSIGMSTLHLPDIQYYFHGIDPNWVVNHAYNVLSYIYSENPEFMQNDTIDGVRDGKINDTERWEVNYEKSLIQPIRSVLNINMGEYVSRK